MELLIVTIAAGILLLFFALIAVEVWLRRRYGLGDPPLYMKDREIEYLMQPSRRYRRKGRIMRINQWCMRSDEFEKSKASADERRVLVLGDSVVFGGQGVDQALIATSLLQAALGERLGVPVVVGNASAASWGPPNLMNYVRRYGTFEADVIVVVMSSHDYADVPAEVSNVGMMTRPDCKPMCALHEAGARYVSNRRRAARKRRGETQPEPTPSEIEWATRDYGELLRVLKQSGAKVFAVLHPERGELDGAWQEGHERLAAIIEREGIERIDWKPAFVKARDAGQSPHEDHIHPTTLGQRLMFETLLAPIEKALRE